MAQRRGVMLRRSQQWRKMATRKHAVAGKGEGKRVGATTESSCAVDDAAWGGPEGVAGGNSGSSGDDRDGRGSRIVSFEERIQVVLVPTRQELHEHQRQQQQLQLQQQLQAQQERLQQQQRQQQQQQQEEKEAVGGRSSDAVLNEGIWWTRSDCNRFRRSFKRQILQQGLQNNVKTLLCPTLLVFRIGAEEERQEEQERGRRESGSGGSADGSACGCGTAGSSSNSTALIIAQDVGVR